jgi:hypothetical protein
VLGQERADESVALALVTNRVDPFEAVDAGVVTGCEDRVLQWTE